MATRFYLGATSAPISPSFDAGWEATGSRNALIYKNTAPFSSALVTVNLNIPITTTQDGAAKQYISVPIPPQRITGTVSFVMSVSEDNAGDNCTLALVVRVLSAGGETIRGTLFSVFGTDTEWALTAATRIVNAQAVTALTTKPGDRLIVEVGGHFAAPTFAGTGPMRSGYNSTQADFALTSALVTDLNPWIEFSQNIFSLMPDNYKFASSVSAGVISVTEKIR